MKIRIEPSLKTLINFWLVPLAIVVAGFAVYSARTALIIIGTAFFLALALNSPVSKLARHLPGKSRVGSTAIAFLLVIAFIGAFLFLAVPPIVQQTAKFVETIPELVESARDQWAGLNHWIVEYNLQPQVDKALKSLENNTGKLAASFGDNIIGGIGSFFGFFTAAILTLVLSFLMLIEGPAWMKRFYGLYDDKQRRDHHQTVIKKMHAVVSGYVTGQLTVSAIGAFFAGLTVFILSQIFTVPANLAIPTAAITFILSMIPMFGATIGGVLVTALLAFNDPAAAIIYFIFFVVYQQVENNYISPTIQSKRIELSPLAVLASVTVGLYLFGIAGGIISIPIAGCIKVLIEEYLQQRRHRVKKDNNTLNKLVKKVTET